MSSSRYSFGFTLVETLVVISLFTLLLLVITTTVYNLYQVNGYTIAQSYEIEEARRGLQTWIEDTREMTFSDTGTYPVAVTESQRIGFYSEVDGDDSVEYVEYRLSSTTLYRFVYNATGTPSVYNLLTPTSTTTLSQFVQNNLQATSTFFYFDSDGLPITGPGALLTDVRYLEARVIVNIDPLRSPGEFLLKSGVAPRNLKDNL